MLVPEAVDCICRDVVVQDAISTSHADESLTAVFLPAEFHCLVSLYNEHNGLMSSREITVPGQWWEIVVYAGCELWPCIQVADVNRCAVQDLWTAPQIVRYACHRAACQVQHEQLSSHILDLLPPLSWVKVCVCCHMKHLHPPGVCLHMPAAQRDIEGCTLQLSWQLRDSAALLVWFSADPGQTSCDMLLHEQSLVEGACKHIQ